MSGPLGAHAGHRPVAPRQLDILRLIERSITARGFPPTYTEMASELGLCRPTIHEHISRLVAKDMLIRSAYTERGIALTDAARAELARARAGTQTTGDSQ